MVYSCIAKAKFNHYTAGIKIMQEKLGIMPYQRHVELSWQLQYEQNENITFGISEKKERKFSCNLMKKKRLTYQCTLEQFNGKHHKNHLLQMPLHYKY